MSNEPGLPRSEATGSDEPIKRIIVVGAEDVYQALLDHVYETVQVACAAELVAATTLFTAATPDLLVCALDDEGWQLTPLLRRASNKKVPILAVARTQDAVDAARAARWAIDRSHLEAIASLALRMLEDPEFYPDDLDEYPRPPHRLIASAVAEGRAAMAAIRVEPRPTAEIDDAEERTPIPESWLTTPVHANAHPRAIIEANISKTPLLVDGEGGSAPVHQTAAGSARHARDEVDELREEVAELRKAAAEMAGDRESTLAWLRGRIERIDENVVAITARLESVEAHLQQMPSAVALFDAVNSLAELAPRFDSLVAEVGGQVDGLSDQVGEFRDRVQALDTELTEVQGRLGDPSQTDHARWAEADERLQQLEKMVAAIQDLGTALAPDERFEALLAKLAEKYETSTSLLSAAERARHDSEREQLARMKLVESRLKYLEENRPGHAAGGGDNSGATATLALEMQQLRQAQSLLLRRLSQMEATFIRGILNPANNVINPAILTGTEQAGNGGADVLDVGTGDAVQASAETLEKLRASLERIRADWLRDAPKSDE